MSFFQKVQPNSIVISLAIATAMIIATNGLKAIESVFIMANPAAIELHLSSPMEWSTPSITLNKGLYYITVGRIRGACKLFWNSHLLRNTGIPTPGYITTLSLDSTLDIVHDEKGKVKVTCEYQRGLDADLRDVPVVLPFWSGRLLQAFRSVTSTWLPLVFPLILVMTCWVFSPVFTSTAHKSPKAWSSLGFIDRLRNPMMFNSVACFAYSISLSSFFFLWMYTYWASIVHICLRGIFGLAFSQLIMSFTRQFKWLTVSYIVIVLCDIAIGVLFSKNSMILIAFYSMHHILFGISTFILWDSMRKTKEMGKSFLLMQHLAFSWGCAQVLDDIIQYLGYYLYSGQVFIVFMTIALVRLRSEEVRITEKIEETIKDTIRILESREPVSSMLPRVCLAMVEHTPHFRRQSIYVDSFCLGRTSKPRERFDRIFERGYETDSTKYLQIFMAEGQGSLMAKAMSERKILFERGRDGGWFCIVPIGGVGCLNFSDVSATSKLLMDEHRRIIEGVGPMMHLLEERLVSASAADCVFLEKIKVRRGLGKWNTKLGVVVIDVENSSALTVESSQKNNNEDLFSPFLVSKYLPALMRRIGSFCELQNDEGDGLVLAILEDTVPSGWTVESSVVEIVRRVYQFVAGDGCQMCLHEGFEPIRLIGGVSIGMGLLICEELRVRIAGHTLIQGARLLKSAPRGSFLVQSEVAEFFRTGEFLLDKERMILGKRDLIRSVPIYFEPFARKVA